MRGRRPRITDQCFPVSVHLPLWLIEHLDSIREQGRIQDQIRSAVFEKYGCTADAARDIVQLSQTNKGEKNEL